MRNVSLAVATFVVLGAAAAIAQQAGKDMKDMNMKPMPAAGTMTTQAKIQQAMKAAPAEISAKAAVVDFTEKDGMPMKQLRAGTNGWTCIPSTPQQSPGASQQDPMCADKGFMSLMDAYMMKSDPKLTSVAIAYMLMGDKGASNTDPFAMAATPTNDWIVSPAHIMIATPDPKQLDVYPTDPHSGGPWVMWKGTKYAHLMVPVAAMPKMPMMTGAKPTAMPMPTPAPGR